ncbi:YolD-like family protein [Paenibacillus sp. UNC451MF]|uniref:YolD-like family protein n=1 Tax=Paenibacillus sp. UNC451MF TaxID=1449063 RepID=UPI00068DA215|nr:YolD-like family protein [Paenibacillus sp. UNC451MF]
MKKLTGNGLWESSRMMLPEHRERSVQLHKQTDRLAKLELMEEELQELFGRLKSSMSNTLEVTVSVFCEYGRMKYTGIVSGLDPRQQLVKLEWLGDWKLIDFKDIIGVEFSAERY